MSPRELRARRLALGLSITDVADRLNIPPRVVSAWERGDEAFEDAVVNALLDAPAAIRRLLLTKPQGDA